MDISFFLIALVTTFIKKKKNPHPFLAQISQRLRFIFLSPVFLIFHWHFECSMFGTESLIFPMNYCYLNFSILHFLILLFIDTPMFQTWNFFQFFPLLIAHFHSVCPKYFSYQILYHHASLYHCLIQALSSSLFVSLPLVLKHWVHETEILIIVFENTKPYFKCHNIFKSIFLYKNFTILFCLKSLCFLDEAKHQDERSAVRSTENHLGVPCMYSDVLATCHAHE